MGHVSLRTRLRRYGPTMPVEMASNELGFSRSHGYQMIKTGEFPARTIKVGRRLVVVTESLIDVLEGA